MSSSIDSSLSWDGKKELVWLPVELAKKYKQYEQHGDNISVSQMEKELLSYVEEVKREIKTNFDSLDNDVLEFKVQMLKMKNAFKETKDEQINAVYDVWENADKQLSPLRKKLESLTSEISSLRFALEALNSSLKGITPYNLEILLDQLQLLKEFREQNPDLFDLLLTLKEREKNGH